MRTSCSGLVCAGKALLELPPSHVHLELDSLDRPLQRGPAEGISQQLLSPALPIALVVQRVGSPCDREPLPERLTLTPDDRP